MSGCLSDILSQSPELDTIMQHLSDISPLLTEGDIRVVLRKRHIAPNTPVDDLTDREIELAEAEAYLKLCDQPVGGSTAKEVDGSWSHTEGGWKVSSENIRQWRQKYIDLREKWGEKATIKHGTRIINF